MIDTTDPIICRLVEAGYKVSLHAHLVGGSVVVSYFAALQGEPKRNFQGRSRKGDPDEALRDLADSAGLLDGQTLSPRFGSR